MFTEADALLGGDRESAVALASKLIKPRSDNFVERPWGGAKLRAFKRSAEADTAGGAARIGESFEIAAFDADEETRTYPSRLRLSDGSEITLPALLARHADVLLGRAFTSRYGACFPLLPKMLDIKELLSVQGHPAGNTEVYVIVDAEPGATIRVGFVRDMHGAAFEKELIAGRGDQKALLELVAPGTDGAVLQALVGPWLAERAAGTAAVAGRLRPVLASGRAWRDAETLLDRLKRLYWHVLDAMNAIPVHAGQVIHNATPARLLADPAREPAAEVHALGNPEGREIVALEIRRPGVTFRAWDNVRFPVRPVDVGTALGALNLRHTRPEELIVEPVPVAGRPGVLRSVESAYFSLEHLRPVPGQIVDVPRESPHCLHALGGSVRVTAPSGEQLGTLERGESALVPYGVGAYRVHAAAPGADVVKVTLPLDAPARHSLL